MTSRRQFLAGGIAGSVFVSFCSARAAVRLTDPNHQALADFVFDERFEHGAVMAQGLDQDVTRIYAMRGDVSEVWYDHLARRLQTGPQAIGGLTTAGGLFVLSRLGHDAGLRLAMQGRHRLTDNGRRAEHALDAPPLIAKKFSAALGSGMSWTSALQVVLHEVASRPPADRISMMDLGVSDMSRQVTLHSWLLTPRGLSS